jgi:dihydropyrimidinase
LQKINSAGKERTQLLDLLIKNGTVVNADQTLQADVGVKDGMIVLIGNGDYFPEAAREIDAAGKWVLPGMIDSHVHINLKLGEFTTKDDFYQASLAAAYGGTTSLIEFAVPYGEETPAQALERRLAEAKGNTVTDYGFHGCVVRGDAQSFRDVEDLVTGGVPSIKMFTVYKDLVMLDKGTIWEVLQIIGKKGGLAKFHAENADIIDSLIHRYVSEGHTSADYHVKSRPAIAELEAISSLLALIEHSGAPSLFVHMSTGKGKDMLRLAREKLPVFTEVCSHYLALTEDVYQGEHGNRYICSPPIRDQGEQDGLWSMMREGLIDVVNSDHCCYDLEQKDKYKNFFPDAPNGLPGIETRGTVLFSEGVAKGRISINQFVDLTSTRTAKLMGMYPRKGVIKAGSEADIVVFDGDTTYTLTTNALHMQTDYTPFEGFCLTGKPTDVIIRGHHIVHDGQLIDNRFRGEFLKRSGPLLK